MSGSFSHETKESLSVLPVKGVHCRRAELAVLLSGLGCYALPRRGVIFLVLQSDNLPALRRADFLLRALYGIVPEVSRMKDPGWLSPLYTLVVREQEAIRRMLTELGYMNAKGALRELETPVPEKLLERECCRKAFLRASFLVQGTISDPKRGYHLEWNTAIPERAEQIRKVLETLGLRGRISERKNGYMVYIKESEQISDALAHMGAFKSRLVLEDIRIYRSIQGEVNRQTNCDTANLRKIADAGTDQAAAIRQIEEKAGLSSLPKDLYDMAVLRLEHPDASLEELGAMLDPPLGKSGVNHRLRKIRAIAAQL